MCPAIHRAEWPWLSWTSQSVVEKSSTHRPNAHALSEHPWAIEMSDGSMAILVGVLAIVGH
jgi:hypothetical protein